MKNITTNQRTGGITTVRGEFNEYLYQLHQVKKFNEDFETVDDFIEKFPPQNPTKNILNAIKSAFKNSGNVTYNTGKGNQTFYFN